MKQLVDYHMHCHYSPDSEATPKQMIERAIRQNLSAICFTDHNDFDYDYISSDEFAKDAFVLDFNHYYSEMCALKEQYAKQISIFIGVEQGLQPHLTEAVNHYDVSHVLDFIIGSTHLVDGLDPYYPSFWEHHSAKERITSFFENTYENICACDNFDVYGHLDYIIRYAPDKGSSFSSDDYHDVIDKILTALINKGKGLEINTAGLKYGCKEANPCLAILKRYRELGGEIITTGSDAHKPEHIAYAYAKLPELLSAAGFDYYTIFKQRKPEFIKLG